MFVKISILDFYQCCPILLRFNYLDILKYRLLTKVSERYTTSCSLWKNSRLIRCWKWPYNIKANKNTLHPFQRGGNLAPFKLKYSWCIKTYPNFLWYNLWLSVLQRFLWGGIDTNFEGSHNQNGSKLKIFFFKQFFHRCYFMHRLLYFSFNL